MFYVLNFTTHRFHTCYNAYDVKQFVESYCNGHPKVTTDFFEVINAFPDGVRMSYEEFVSKENEFA